MGCENRKIGNVQADFFTTDYLLGLITRDLSRKFKKYKRLTFNHIVRKTGCRGADLCFEIGPKTADKKKLKIRLNYIEPSQRIAIVDFEEGCQLFDMVITNNNHKDAYHTLKREFRNYLTRNVSPNWIKRFGKLKFDEYR